MPLLPEGLLIELVTPLTPTGSLDHLSLERLVARVRSAGGGLIAGSPGIGEALELPPALRLELFAHLLTLVPPEVPLFFGLTGATQEDTRSLALHLEQKAQQQPGGRRLFWLDLPLWWHSNRGLPQALENLCRGLSYPLVLMNHPHVMRGKAKPLKHVNIRTAVLKKLTGVPGLAALIYQGEMRRFLHYYSAVAMRPEFVLYEADERRFLIRPGARGLVSAGAQLFPLAWREVAQACLYPGETPGQAQNRRLVLEWSQYLLDLQELYQLHPAGLIKLGLQHLGIIEFSVSWPTTPSYPAHLGEQFLTFLDTLHDTGMNSGPGKGEFQA